jgi:hypothetical protein
MANSKVQYTADGSTQSFAVTFPFISRSHVSVEVDGSNATFTWNNDSQITIASPTLSGSEIVLIARSTSQSTRLVDYVDGSNLTETDLDLDSKQAFYMAQESLDELTLLDDAAVATSAHILVGNGTTFTNVAVSGDVTITNGGAVTIANTAVETAMIANDAINGTKIADDAIDSEHYTDGSIDTAHIADLNVTTGKIANDAITGAKIELFDDSYAATNGHILVADGTDFDNVAMSGDVTISNTGVTSIATGVIGNTDINGSAAIDASKIHNGNVSNAEFAYLDGVTSSIQTQLNSISAGAISTVQDDVFAIQDDGDNTKQITFQASGITSGATRTITMPDSNVTLGTPNDNTVSLAKLAGGTDGNLITYDTSGDPAHVATGNSGQILTSNGAGAAPTFQAATGATNGFAIAMAVAL